MFEDIFGQETDYSDQTGYCEEDIEEEKPVYKKTWTGYINSQKRWDASKKDGK